MSNHNERIDQLAQRYRSEGYEVVIEPRSESLPVDLGSYQPDLWCRKRDENIIIEVKSGKFRDSIDRYKDIAKRLQSSEGWKFILIQDSDDNNSDYTYSNNIDKDNIISSMNKSKILYTSGMKEYAFLLWWNIALQILKERAMDGESMQVNVTDKNIINNTYSNGIIDMKIYDDMKYMNSVRNKIVHSINPQISEEDARKMIEIIRVISRKYKLDDIYSKTNDIT